jgi:hypothetical protein
MTATGMPPVDSNREDWPEIAYERALEMLNLTYIRRIFAHYNRCKRRISRTSVGIFHFFLIFVLPHLAAIRRIKAAT